MISVVLDVVGAVLLLIGLTLMTIGLVGVLRMPDTYAPVARTGPGHGAGGDRRPRLLGRHRERRDHHVRRARDRVRRADLAGVRACHRHRRPAVRPPGGLTAAHRSNQPYARGWALDVRP